MEWSCTLAVLWDSTVFYWRKIKLCRVIRRAHRGVSRSSVNFASWLLLWRSTFLKAEVNLSGGTQLPALLRCQIIMKTHCLLSLSCSSSVCEKSPRSSPNQMLETLNSPFLFLKVFLFHRRKKSAALLYEAVFNLCTVNTSKYVESVNSNCAIE